MKYMVKVGFYEYRTETMQVSVDDDLPVEKQEISAKKKAKELVKQIFYRAEKLEIQSVNKYD